MIAQSAGAVIAGFLLKLGAGSDHYFPIVGDKIESRPPLRLTAQDIIPGCTIDTSTTSAGQEFVLELMFGFAGIFMAFGVGLDPRQSKIYGTLARK